MPEGDTLARAAASLAQWLGGRTITAARGRDPRLGIERLIGCTLRTAQAHGKHLLLQFDPPNGGPGSGFTLRTHMKMNGSWHVYPRAARWRRAAFRAVVVLETGDRIAVGFDIPDLELAAVSRRNADAGAPLRRLDALGPDILQEPPDTAAMVARARSHSEAAITLGELLLDQRVAAGIGNMWRAEALFACRMSPWSPVTSVSDAALHELFETAASLMRASVVGRRPPEQVYGRNARPCRRCGTPIAAKPQGQHARMAYWCPSCQPGDDRRREDDH